MMVMYRPHLPCQLVVYPTMRRKTKPSSSCAPAHGRVNKSRSCSLENLRRKALNLRIEWQVVIRQRLAAARRGVEYGIYGAHLWHTTSFFGRQHYCMARLCFICQPPWMYNKQRRFPPLSSTSSLKASWAIVVLGWFRTAKIFALE